MTDLTREHGLSRRRLLRALPAVAGTLLLTGAAPAATAPVPRATTAPRPRAPQKPAPHRTPAVALPAFHRPIYTLDDYRRAVGGPAFPSHAIALTIDDGPHPVWTPRVLRLLDRFHVPALFCMIGNQVRGHESIARSVVHDGHQVANHTWSHPMKLARQRVADMRREIIRAQDSIYSTTSRAPMLFRAPGGAWSPALFRTLQGTHMVPLDWSDDPRDWSKPGVAAITRRLLKTRPGQILLCHDGGGDRSQTYAALRTVIPTLQARGYHFVALDRRV